MEHHVYFWLKADRTGADDCAAFEAGLEKLCGSPNIGRSKWGKPAPTEARPVTDHSWSYGLSLAFESMEAHDAYQSDSDELHTEFIESFKDWWEKVLVMDLQ